MTLIKKNGIIFIAAVLLAISIVVIGLTLYNQGLNEDLSETTRVSLEEVLQQQRFNFNSSIENQVGVIKLLSKSIASLHKDVNIADFLQDAVNNSDFETFQLYNEKGYNKQEYIGGSEYFKKFLNGETVVLDEYKSNKEGECSIYTPVTINQRVVGVLVGSYPAKNLDNLLLPSFNGMGYAFVVDLSGRVIARTDNSAYSLTKSDNIFDVLSTANYLESDHFQQITKYMSLRNAGHSKYESDGNIRIVYFAPLNISDWYIFCIVPDEVVFAKANEITGSAALLSVVTLVVMALLLLYVYVIQRSHLKDIAKVAFTDELTGIRNMSKFKVDARELLLRNPHTHYTLVKLDIQKFKLLNDVVGYKGGNKLLLNLSRALGKVLDEKHELYAREGSDVFIALLATQDDGEIESKRVQWMRKFADMSKEIAEYRVVFHTGRYKIEPGERDIHRMIEKVNFAHKLSKSRENKMCDYDDKVKAMALAQLDIEKRMEDALANQEFVVYLQPKYRLADEKLAGAEALVRWQRANVDTIYPGTFIPLFEENGFIIQLDMYMFDKTCALIRSWMDAGKDPVVVSVNFSRLHLSNGNFVGELEEIADRHNTPHEYLEIELTETAIYDNVDILESVIDKLHQAGFTLSMDDFGTGYSSLGLLKNIPVDVIKMDRAFFGDSRDASRAFEVIKSVMDMAKKLNIHTVAEGVETLEHVTMLKELGCDFVQGYYYAKPQPAAEFLEKL